MAEQNLISVGKTIRDVTTYLLNQYIRTMKDLSTQPSIDRKKEELVSLCKTYNSFIKKAYFFIQNCQKSNKILNIKIKIEDLVWYKNKITFINDQFYFIMRMCKEYRTPEFNLHQAIETINMCSHSYLKSRIYDVFNNDISLYSNCSKEKKFEFIEKYGYNQNLNAEYNFKNLFKDINLILNIQVQLFKIQDNNDILEITFKDNLFDFSFKNIISYQLYPNFLKSENNNVVFYYEFKDISATKENFTFIKYYDNLKKEIDKLNMQELKFEINPHEKKNIDLGLGQLKTFLYNFTKKNVYTLIFDYYEEKIRKYCDKFDFPKEVTKISNEDKMDIEDDNEENKNKNKTIIIEFKFDNNILSEDLKNNFKIYFTSMFEIGKIKVNSSFVIVSYDPFIYIENEESIFNIDDFPFKKIINKYFEQYRKIVLNCILEKMINISYLIIPFEFILNENGIDLFILYSNHYHSHTENNGEHILIFSIFLNSYGKIDIIDYDLFFSNESILNVKNIIFNYIQNDTIDQFKFNEIIISHFIQKYFSFLNMKISVQSINFNENIIQFKMNIPKYKFDLSEIYFIIKVNYNQHPILKVQSFDIFFVNSKTPKQILNIDFMKYLKLKRNVYYFYPKYLQQLFNDITKTLIDYDELLKNIFELILFYEIQDKNILHEDKGKSVIILEGNNLSNYRKIFEKEELYILFRKIVNKIEISTKNIIFKVYLNKENLENYFSNKKLKSFSYLESEIIISFDKDFTLSYYILTKLKSSDWNSSKKVLSEIIPKNFHFLEKINKLCEITENKKYFISPSDYYISPICLYFKFNSNGKNRNVYIQFKLLKSWNIMIFPTETHFDTFDFDLKKLLEESNEINLIKQIQYYCFINSIFENLTKYFSSYWLMNIKIAKDEGFKGKVIVLCKDYNTFEIYAKDKFSIYIEVDDSHTILIYSNLSLNEDKQFFGKIEEQFKNYQNQNQNQTMDIFFREPECDMDNDFKKIITIRASNEDILIEKVNRLCSFLKDYLNG